MNIIHKYILLFLTCICTHFEVNSQVSSTHQFVMDSIRLIDPETEKQWFGVRGEQHCALSSDGRYATWSTYNLKDKTSSFFIGATGGAWRQEFHNKKRGDGFFTADDRKYIFPIREGLCIVPLGAGHLGYIHEVANWQQDGRGRWLAWQGKNSESLVLENLRTGKSVRLEALKDFIFDKTGQWLIGRTSDGKALVLYQLTTGKKLQYHGVERYSLKDDGRALLLQLKNKSGTLLQHVNLLDGKIFIVYKTDSNTEILSYLIDSTGTQVAFVLKGKQIEEKGLSVWYYKTGSHEARKLVDDHTPGVETNQLVSIYNIRFTNNSQYLCFNLLQKSYKRAANSGIVNVALWSYNDQQFYTAQPTTNPETNYAAVVNLDSGSVIQLVNQEYEQLEGEPAGGYALISRRQVGDRFWEYKRDSIWLVSLKNGLRTLLPCVKTNWIELDKDGKKVNYFDTQRGRHYYQYDIVSETEKKISENVSDWKLGIENPFWTGWQEKEKEVNHVIACRMADGNSILVYDSYDIWMIDLSGRKQATNITNGYGRKYKIVFRLAAPDNEVITSGAVLILTAFNEENKENGFYRKRVYITGDPDSLFMGPYFFSHDRKILGNLMPDPYGTGMLPVKAANTDAWIVKRESATAAPNYFFTRDLKTFRPLTDLQPQKEYNWYTTELINYTQEDGVANQGILYKPANFDPNKKYPVLFYYYEQYTYGLNCFIPPVVTETGKPNIPWYVSRGYLVFTQDNYFQKGLRAKSCFLSVEGAARHLSRLPFVDSHRMGVMGLSQGGGFTNYIITHSNLFAAAFEGCGVSNSISAALQLVGVTGEGGTRLQQTEKWNGTNMWDTPEYWISQSPVLSAQKVTTPLLIMHNRDDGAVPFAQGIEIFTALWRLNKKVWLLQYDKGGHGVNGEECLDLTTRMTQYFDHYLKGAPPPRWMTQGIPKYLKGIESRYELDLAGSCGKNCKICEEKKYATYHEIN